MKNRIQQLVLSLLLFSSALLAQVPVVQLNQLGESQEVRLGTSNKYPIGTSDDPVYATEYCDFLNEKSSNDRPWIESSYYDSSFMNTNANWSWQNNPKACINRLGRSGGYQYNVIASHENDIIVAVYYNSLQQEFGDWRAKKQEELADNPTRQELCDYINNKIAAKLDASYLDKALEIEHRYPNATVANYGRYWFPVSLYSSASVNPASITFNHGMSLWDQVDQLVDYIHNGYYGVHFIDGTNVQEIHHAASDTECNEFVKVWGLSFSNESDVSLGLPSDMPMHAVLLDGVRQEQRRRWAKARESEYIFSGEIRIAFGGYSRLLHSSSSDDVATTSTVN